MRLLRSFASVALLFLFNIPPHSAPAQDSPSVEDTMNWITSHLLHSQYRASTQPGEALFTYTSVTFPDDGGYRAGGRKGCMMQVTQNLQLNNSESRSTFKIYFNLLYYPVKIGRSEAGIYLLSFVQAFPPANADGPFAFRPRYSSSAQEEGRTAGGIGISPNQEDAERMGKAMDNLIKLCGGKPEAF